jgi:KDO2-lipid IV(A) lauroyltransferase
MSAEPRRTFARLALSPGNWPLLLGLALMRLLILLPYRWQLTLGRGLGAAMYHVIPKRRQVAATNLAICFPELDADEQQTMLREHFASLGIAVFELALAWWGSDSRVARLTRIDGLRHLTDELEAGHGVVLLSAHFAATELTGRKLVLDVPDMAAMYRSNKNELMDEVLRRSRSGSIRQLIPKDDMRQMIRVLRKGGVPVWYASDQSYRHKYHELVPFFGEPAMTNAALSHIVRITKAKVVPYLPRRLPDGQGYHVDILPALEDFPGESPAADAERINRMLEERIRMAPAQYYWVHRRFKDRPPPLTDPYRAGG